MIIRSSLQRTNVGSRYDLTSMPALSCTGVVYVVRSMNCTDTVEESASMDRRKTSYFAASLWPSVSQSAGACCAEAALTVQLARSARRKRAGNTWRILWSRWDQFEVINASGFKVKLGLVTRFEVVHVDEIKFELHSSPLVWLSYTYLRMWVERIFRS